MLQRASVASILACLVVTSTPIALAQKKDLGSVMVSSHGAASVAPKSGAVVYTDECKTCGPLFGEDASEGAWEWVRDPLQQRRRAVRIYNLHCVRCHGVNGRGVWDIPDVPDFTDQRWQMSRSDADIVRLTLGGRGACMPAFKGTITRAEACAITRYIRTFGPMPAERPATRHSTRSPSTPVQPPPAVTRQMTTRPRTDVASRSKTFQPSSKSKSPLHWFNPFSKKQPSVKQ